MPSILSKAFVATLAFAAAQAIPLVPREDGSTDHTALLAKLLTTPTTVKRQRQIYAKEGGASLLDAADLQKSVVFDFAPPAAPDAPTTPGSQGSVASSANIETFPILLNTGLTVNHGTLGPCGVVLPHIHPRATEFFVTVSGDVHFGFMPETGLLTDPTASSEVTGRLSNNTGVVFPQGAIHYVVNDSPECATGTFYAILSSEDAGTTPVLQDPTRLSANGTVMRRTVGLEDFEAVKGFMPQKMLTAVQECIKRCDVK